MNASYDNTLDFQFFSPALDHFNAMICHLESACLQDHGITEEYIRTNGSELLRRMVESVLVDGGYTGQPFANATDEILGASVQVAKRSELHTFAVIPERWVVERSFAWIENCRRLWKNTERKLNTSLQFTHLAFLALLLRRL